MRKKLDLFELQLTKEKSKPGPGHYENKNAAIGVGQLSSRKPNA